MYWRALLVIVLLGHSGCHSPGTQAVARPEFAGYDRVALWSSLPREIEDLFIPLYMEAFPTQVLVERRDVSAIIGEQDILPERLDESTRAKLRQILGVKAIVYPRCGEDGFALKVIQTDTGAITASVFVDATAGVQKVPPKVLVRRAVAALKSKAGSAPAVAGVAHAE